MSDVSVSIGVTGKEAVLGAFSQVGAAAKKLGSIGLGAINTAAMAGFGASLAAIGASMAGVKGALDLGGEMVDLSNRTGVAVESLYGLRMAFKDAGVDAEKLGPAVNKMQKSLASAASGGKQGDVLKSLGLDPQALASMDAGQAFAQIGARISQLQNSTERAAASMAIFGKSGAELLQVFMDPAFKEAGNISETARLLGENAGIFDRASDALGRSGSKVTGFFVGVASQVVPQLTEAVAAFERLDLASAGKDVGNVVSIPIQAMKEGMMGKLIWLDLKVAFENAINFLAGGIFALFASIPAQMGIAGTLMLEPFRVLNETSFWTGMFNTFMGMVNLFNAKLLDGVAALVGALRNVPIIGEKIGGGADAIQERADSFRALSVTQSVEGGDSVKRVMEGSRARILESFNYAISDFQKKFQSVDLFGGGSGQQLDELISFLYDSGSVANAKARADNASRVTAQGTFNASDIGMGGKPSLFADSLAKIGGGGIGGGGSNPILEENRRQTGLLTQINQTLAKGMMSPVMAEFAPAY